MAKSNPIGVRFDLDLLLALSEDKIAETPQKVLNFLTEFYRENRQKDNLKEVFENSKLFNKKEVAEPQNTLGSEKPKSNISINTIPGYPTDFNGLLKMAKEGVSNEGEFKAAVASSKLNGNQKSMVLSKLK